MVKRQRGFTLVELLVALALSMVGLLGLLALQMLAIRSNATSRGYAEATALAQERVEVLQTTPYAALITVAEPPMGANPGSTQTLYTRTTTVTDNVINKTIRVQVTWDDAYTAGKTHNVSLYLVRTP
jgi:prepilin-type N-terminal cleavage/methylation domain-containing protein